MEKQNNGQREDGKEQEEKAAAQHQPTERSEDEALKGTAQNRETNIKANEK